MTFADFLILEFKDGVPYSTLMLMFQQVQPQSGILCKSSPLLSVEHHCRTAYRSNCSGSRDILNHSPNPVISFVELSVDSHSTRCHARTMFNRVDFLIFSAFYLVYVQSYMVQFINAQNMRVVICCN